MSRDHGIRRQCNIDMALNMGSIVLRKKGQSSGSLRILEEVMTDAATLRRSVDNLKYNSAAQLHEEIGGLAGFIAMHGQCTEMLREACPQICW